MTKIKVVGALIFLISILLVFLFNHINKHHSHNSNLLKSINQQKAFTQEISKNIFYISKHKNSSTKQLNNSIKQFLLNMENRDDNLDKTTPTQIKKQSAKIILLWNEFYILVQNFKDQQQVTTPYSSILLEKTVIDIYNKNLELVVEFNKLLQISKEHISHDMNICENLQYTLLIILVLLLLYLFTQLKSRLEFIQKFLHTSTKIINNSSIEHLAPIDIKRSTDDVSEASKNFNQLVEEINSSVKNSSDSLEHSYKSLNIVEHKIETLMELLYSMQESNNIDDNLTKKEDAIIQSLEELTSSNQNLQNLQKELNNLLSNYNK